MTRLNITGGGGARWLSSLACLARVNWQRVFGFHFDLVAGNCVCWFKLTDQACAWREQSIYKHRVELSTVIIKIVHGNQWILDVIGLVTAKR